MEAMGLFLYLEDRILGQRWRKKKLINAIPVHFCYRDPRGQRSSQEQFILLMAQFCRVLDLLQIESSK